MGVRAKYLKKLFTSDLLKNETRKQARARLWNEANKLQHDELLTKYGNYNFDDLVHLINLYLDNLLFDNEDIPQILDVVENPDDILSDLIITNSKTPNLFLDSNLNHDVISDELSHAKNIPVDNAKKTRIAGYNQTFKKTFGDNPDVSVTDMLQQLKTLDLYKGEIDGLWGPKSLQAYAEYLKLLLKQSGNVLQGGPNWIDFIDKTTVALGGPVARSMNLRYYHLDWPLVHLPLFEPQNGASSATVRLVEALADPVTSVANPSLGMGTVQTTELQPANTTNNQTSLKNWNYKTADNKNIDLSQFSFGNGDWWKPQEYTAMNAYGRSATDRLYYTDAAGNAYYLNLDGTRNYGLASLFGRHKDEFGSILGNVNGSLIDKAKDAFRSEYRRQTGNYGSLNVQDFEKAFDQWLYNTTGKHQWDQFKQGGIMKKRIGSYLSGGQVNSKDNSEEFLMDLAKIVGVEPNQIGAVIQKLGKKNVEQLYHIWGNAKEANKLDKDAGKKAIIAAIQGSQSSGRLQTSGPEQIAYNAPPSAQLGRMGLRFHELQGTCPEGYEIDKFLAGGCVKCRKKKALELKCGGKKRFTKH